MMIKHEYKIITLLTILTLALFFMVSMVILPTLAQIKKVNNEATALKVFLEKSIQDSQVTRHSLAEQANARAEIMNLGSHLYHIGDDLKLIDEMENLANTLRVNITISNFNADPAARRVRLDMLIQGDYPAIVAYLAQLAQSNYYPRLNLIEVAADNSGHNDFLKAKLQIETYAAQ